MDALPPEDLAQALEAARTAYAARHPRSAEALRHNRRFMPGGNTRSVLFYDPFPLVMARGEGCHLWDADGHRYVDLLGEFTAGLYGHSEPVIRAALQAALEDGLNLGAHNLLEGRLAELVCARFPSVERVRFTNSGTEANLMALAAAKAFTGRSRILVFHGAYHGGVLTFVSGPSAASVPHDFLLAPYNDTGAAVRLIREHADALAAVLVEPMLGSGGCIPGEPGFLAALRAETAAAGALLILDEVMTSRMAAGGRQAMLGITADLTTLGKYIGGGMSFGAFGGRADIMALFDPARPGGLPHAGTFNNNVLTMAAGAAGLARVFTPEAAEALFARGEALRGRLNALCRAKGLAMQFTGLGSLMNAHFTAAPIRRPADAAAGDARLRDLFFFDMVEAGFYLARRGLVALMLPLGPAETEGFAAAVERFLERRAALIGPAERLGS